MGYRDNLAASLAQNDALASAVQRAAKKAKTDPIEIPDLDDVVLELLMGWEGDWTWTGSGMAVLKTGSYGGDNWGIGYKIIGVFRKKVEVCITTAPYNVWHEWDSPLKTLHVVKGAKAKKLIKAMSFFYIKRKTTR